MLTVDEAGRFGGTPPPDTLRTDAPRSLRGFALALTNSAHSLPWIKFVASVRSGHSQAHDALGMDFFDYLERNPGHALGEVLVPWCRATPPVAPGRQ